MSGSNGSGFLFTANGGIFGHLGPAAGVAYNPAAPTDEVSDANREVLSAYGGETPPVDLVRMVGEWANLQRAEQVAGRMLSKALNYSNPGAASPMARTQPILNHIGGAGGLYTPKQGIPFPALKQLAKRIEVVQAIHRTRQRQVLAFAEPSTKDDQTGWRLAPFDSNAKLDEDHELYLRWLTQFLLCGGRQFDALERRRLGRENISTFLRKLVDDSLTLDHCAVETVPLKGALGLDSFHMRDSATFFFHRDRLDSALDAYAVQEVLAGSIETFGYNELFVFQRQPLTDLEWCGYGYSELESSIETISNFLQAVAFTREGIDNNAIPRGLLVLSGSYDQNQLQAFNAAWQAKLRGAGNAFGLPALVSKTQGDVQFVQTGAPFSEMAFAKWISLQTAITSSVYGIDPAEIGMEGFTAEKASLSGDDTAERLAAARDKGLRPFLTDIATGITEGIISRFSPWVRFSFTGLQASDEKWKAEQRARMSTIDELRQSLGMDKHPIPSIGALPADPGVLSAEFQRYQAILTVDEARKAWGGLPEYPNAQVGMTPLNPSLQAVASQALAPAPPPMPPGAEDGQFPGGDEDGEDGQFGDGAEPQDGFGGDVSSRLHDLRGQGEE